MRHLAAYLLAVLGGKANPTEDDIKAILDAAGVESNDEKIGKLIAELKNKDLNEIIAAGRAKLSTVPSGGGAPRASGAPAAPVSGGGGGTKQPEKAPEPEEKEDEDEGLGFDLFG
jgi:large subunit ribosomal protein LP2